MKLKMICTSLLLSSTLAGQAFAEESTIKPVDGAAVMEKAEKPQLAPPRSIYDQAFDDAYKQATEGWMEDPFKHIGADMSHCVDQLAALKTDKPVQQRQDQVVNRLNAVIAMLEKECSGGSGSNPNPTKPLGKSIIAKGPGGQGDMHDPKEGEKQWASLPPKQREQILQSKTEGFPPGFEAVLQSYYERLAQERLDEPAGAASEAPTPAALQGAAQ